MAYESISSLPAAIRKALPKSAQAVYRKAFNESFKKSQSETRADGAAWQAVKSRFQQDAEGNWLKKEAPGVGAVHVDGVSWKTKPKKPKIAKGQVIKSVDAKRYTLGIVYEPDVEDTQGDFATAEEIERACWEFNRRQIGTGKEFAKRRVRKGALGIQHQDWNDDHGEIIESYIAPCDMRIGDEQITKGTWLMGVIWSPENWAKIQSGDLTGLSMGGTARREEA